MATVGMWVGGDQLGRLDAALEAGRATDVDRLLAEIFASPGTDRLVATVCAVCRRDLVRGGAGGSGLVVSTCPAGHGAWLDRDALAGLRGLVVARTTTLRTRRIAVLSTVLALGVAALIAAKPTIGPASMRSPSMPEAERRYVGELLAVLKDGIDNRRTIEGVLTAESAPNTYAAAYEAYRGGAEAVIARLRALVVPDRLRTAHQGIVHAAELQIVFYADFATARARDRSTDLARMLGHPALRESDYELHAAWTHLTRTYPDLAPTLKTVEDHLCWFDAI